MRALAALVALLALAGCLEGGETPATPTPSVPTVVTPTPTSPVPLPAHEALHARSLDRGSFSGIHEDTRLAITDEATWRSLWARHRPNTSAPSFEVGNETVIAVVVHGPTGCAGIRLGTISYDLQGTTSVPVIHETAPENVQCLVAFEDVYEFVAIPSRPGDVVFTDRTEPAKPSGDPEGSFAFRTLDQGSTSGIDEEIRRVVPDIDAWRALWIQHTTTFDPAPPMPGVDWERERVLAVTAGARGNTCWAIRVDAIDVGADNVTAQVTTTRPPPGMACGMAITHPFHFVTYPITEAPLVVVEREG